MEKSVLHSPFKFLHPFDRQDAAVFFEREDDVERLYELVCKNRLVLVYGPSGAGKTSLVQCGLYNRFEITDWKPFIIRRGHDINYCMLQALHDSKALGKVPMPELHGEDMTNRLLQTIELAGSRYLRPVYFIFDQFEEFLLLAKEAEQKQFLQSLQAIIAAQENISCNLIFIISEEYFGWLGTLERSIPQFSNRRIRVDPVNREAAKSIVYQSFAHFNITMEDPDAIVEQIINIVAPGRSVVSLPYLQVYLDQLWKDDYNRTYKAQPYTGELQPAPLHLTLQEVYDFGDIKQVLSRFLEERKEAIAEELKLAHADFKKDDLHQLLDCFVTGYGTKLSLLCKRVDGAFVFEGDVPEYVENMAPTVRNQCFDALISNRILRHENNRLELAHDTLAALINEQRSEKQRMQYEFAVNLNSAYKEYQRTGLAQDYLPLNKVHRYEEYLDGMGLEPDIRHFFEKSKWHGEQEAYKKRRAARHSRRLAIYIAVMAVFLTVLFYLAYRYGRNANNNYALVYLGYDLDSISDKKAALKLANYLYGSVSGQMSEGQRQRMEARFTDQFQHQAIQGLFSNVSRTIQSTNLGLDEFAISETGAYIVYKNDLSNAPGGAAYELLDVQKGTVRKIEGKVLYAYFINPQTALVAIKNNAALHDSLQQLADYPTAFVLLRCNAYLSGEATGYDTVRISNGYLYPRSVLYAKERSEYDSYRVWATSAGNLVVPYLKKSAGNNNLIRQLRIIVGGKAKEQESSSTISHAKDNTAFMTGYYKAGSNPVIQVHDQSGKLMQKLDGIYFADFTEKGSLIYINKGSLVLQKRGADSSRGGYVHPDIDYAYADGDEGFAVMKTSRDTVFTMNLKTKEARAHRGKLAGVNFDNKVFITLNHLRGKGGYEIQRNYLDGRPAQRRVFDDTIMKIVYNKPKDALLVLVRVQLYKYHLLLLNQNLKTVAGFKLTPNDIFGFSRNGEKFFYVRDNEISVFANSNALIDHLHFSEAHQWLQSQPWVEDSLKQLKSRYHLKMPVAALAK